MLRLRAGCDPASATKDVTCNLLTELPPPDGAVVAGYWPIGDELDARPALLSLAARGHLLALPTTPPRGQPLTFRAWAPGGDLLSGRFGTLEPPAGAPDVTPTFLLVPLLAFDRRGGRLGYGAGYYDRTLASLPGATAVGLAFHRQEVAEVPTGPGDAPLHAIVTDREVILSGVPVPGGPMLRVRP